MWKWFKRLIVLVIVVFFAVAALLIPDKIDSQDQISITINEVAAIGFGDFLRAWLQRSRFSGVRSFIH